MTEELPKGFRADYIECNGVKLHVVHNGNAYENSPLKDERKPLLCLHGFPEFWMCWEEVAKLLGDEYLVVIPDQRGCGKSDMPSGADNYTAKILVLDMVELSAKLFGNRKFHLAGHDFGAAIAYPVVFTIPDRVEKLVVANGAHPVCLQEALIDSPAQAEASSYFHVVRAEGAGKRAAANDFKIMFEFLESHSTQFRLTDASRKRFSDGWESGGRLDAMFNWYRVSPMVVPAPGDPVPDASLYGVPSDKFRVPVPHLLVWGMEDSALLPETRKRLPEFCDDLVIREVDNADHWVLYTHPELVAGMMREFLDAT